MNASYQAESNESLIHKFFLRVMKTVFESVFWHSGLHTVKKKKGKNNG